MGVGALLEDELCLIVKLVLIFFQAEDGIRDHCVTGVQTCALPICHGAQAGTWRLSGHRVRTRRWGTARSEERRVGKECRGGRFRYVDDKQLLLQGLRRLTRG